MRFLIEILHLVAGLAAAALIAALAAWSYPLAKGDVWLVAGVAMVAVVAMGIKPLMRARRADDAERRAAAARESDAHG